MCAVFTNSHVDCSLWNDGVIAACELPKPCNVETITTNHWFSTVTVRLLALLFWFLQKQPNGKKSAEKVSLLKSVHLSPIVHRIVLTLSHSHKLNLMKRTYLWTQVESYYIHIKRFNSTTVPPYLCLFLLLCPKLLRNNWITNLYRSIQKKAGSVYKKKCD